MNTTWTRRRTLLAGCASGLLLAACGSGSTVSGITPTRVLAVGDDFSDVGQNGTFYTVNDGTLNWVQQLASYYNLTVTPASAGGWGYAQGHARVAAADTTSGTQAPSVTAQVDTLLARVQFEPNDIMIINGGMNDVIDAVNTYGISSQATAAVNAAAIALADQVRRLANAGATHVAVVGVYNLGISPWARGLNQSADIEKLTIAFNDTLLIHIADLGNQGVLFLDAALFYNLMANKPSTYPVDNTTQAVCTTTDATTCTPSTIVAGADYNRWLFADNLRFTPAAQRLFVNENYLENAYRRIKLRW